MDKDRQKEKLSKFGGRYDTIGVIGCKVTAENAAIALATQSTEHHIIHTTQEKVDMVATIQKAYPDLTLESLDKILLKIALVEPTIPSLELAKLMPKINTKPNQTKNQQKRCAKGLHQYRRTEEKQEDSNMIKVVWVCDCGEVEKHFRNK